ncbi:putative proline dehydrogenase 2 [Lasiodiplodia hormozganensis]|uniref:Proline dehydrogenase n=1 Tax=Lasiodiplodia hormozganensis TaxID=869390 RepID=A0AA39YVV1_9PEZI|nr:putative proline dehydrogenase 2 [Lasiodiplodia hormozganensis]
MKPRIYPVRPLLKPQIHVLSINRRYVQSTKPKAATIAVPPLPETPRHTPAHAAVTHQPPLAYLPLKNVIRTYLITRISSSPALWGIFFWGLQLLATPKTALLDPDKNRALNWVLKKTFYSQFCAGENGAEVAKTTKAVKGVGYHGIILEYALEVLLDGIEHGPVPGADSPETKREIEEWRRGMLYTVEMAGPGEFAALKWSGLGRYALHLLKQNKPPTPLMDSAIREVCDAAAAKNLALLPGAEEEITNAGIDTWTLALEREYNRHETGQTIMYNTYQAYLKSTPEKIARHLADAREHGYTIGIKLVRGAYLASEPKSQVWSSKAETDRVYNSLAESLLRRQYGEVLRPAPGSDNESFPQVALVLATHNAESVRRAQEIRNQQVAAAEPRITLAYAQLMGMADEVGCELVQAGKLAMAEQGAHGAYGPLWRKVDIPKAYKCLCWGTAGECLQFLLRRAAENKDAATRTATTRKAMAGELKRRIKVALRLTS